MFMDAWLIGGVLAVMFGLFFDDFKPNPQTGKGYSFSVYFVFYMLVFVFSWFSIAIILGQEYRDYKENLKKGKQ